MKILWFSNVAILEDEIKATGAWSVAMYKELLYTSSVEIINVTCGKVTTPTQKNYKNFEQWLLPIENLDAKGLPSKSTVEFIKNLEQRIKPDVIHIWGTEGYWGNLHVYNILKAKVLLEIQGLLGPFAEVFYGGLSFTQRLKSIGPKEILLPNRLLYFKKNNFRKGGKLEQRIIESTSFVSVQSDWSKQYVSVTNPKLKIFNTGRILRKEFYNSSKWDYGTKKKHQLFTTTSGSNSYKGLHVLFEALAILKHKFPDVVLKIGGRVIYEKKIQDGYSYYLQRLIRKLRLEQNVVWLGALAATAIITELHESNVFVIPSYAETYCNAFAESLYIGVPNVISYAGAMPELADDKISALYFPVGDFRTCAYKIEQIFNDDAFAQGLSINAIKIAEHRSNIQPIVENQINIYKQVIGL